jgi:hypothetical protein
MSASSGSSRRRRPEVDCLVRVEHGKVDGPIDNGNGTISFVTQITGLVLKFQITNGPVLRAANGEPIRSAGDLTLEDVFDAATGDYITTNESFSGPHLAREGVDICGPSVAYLLDPWQTQVWRSHRAARQAALCRVVPASASAQRAISLPSPATAFASNGGSCRRAPTVLLRRSDLPRSAPATRRRRPMTEVGWAAPASSIGVFVDARESHVCGLDLRRFSVVAGRLLPSVSTHGETAWNRHPWTRSLASFAPFRAGSHSVCVVRVWIRCLV